MYHISIYFDPHTTNRIQQYIRQIAKHRGNNFMLDHAVPPHITLSAFETRAEEEVISLLNSLLPNLSKGAIQWASVGFFFPHVIYLAPVLNEYLHTLSCQIYNGLSALTDIRIRPCYQPFHWMPHATLGKQLTQEELHCAFLTMQNQFGMFSGEVTRIGLAKTNPYCDLWSGQLH